MDENERQWAADAHRQKRQHAVMRPFLKAFDAIAKGEPPAEVLQRLTPSEFVSMPAVFICRSAKAVKLDVGQGEIKPVWIPRVCLGLLCDNACKTAKEGDRIDAEITRRFAAEKGLA